MRVRKWRDGWGEGIREGRGGLSEGSNILVTAQKQPFVPGKLPACSFFGGVDPNACAEMPGRDLVTCARPSKRTTCNMPRAVCRGTTASVRASSGRYIAPKYVIGPKLSRNRRPVSTGTRLPKYIIIHSYYVICHMCKKKLCHLTA